MGSEVVNPHIQDPFVRFILDVFGNTMTKTMLSSEENNKPLLSEADRQGIMEVIDFVAGDMADFLKLKYGMTEKGKCSMKMIAEIMGTTIKQLTLDGQKLFRKLRSHNKYLCGYGERIYNWDARVTKELGEYDEREKRFPVPREAVAYLFGTEVFGEIEDAFCQGYLEYLARQNDDEVVVALDSLGLLSGEKKDSQAMSRKYQISLDKIEMLVKAGRQKILKEAASMGITPDKNGVRGLWAENARLSEEVERLKAELSDKQELAVKDYHVDELDLSVRAVNLLKNNGVNRLSQLSSWTRKEFFGLKGAGRIVMQELDNLLREKNEVLADVKRPRFGFKE